MAANDGHVVRSHWRGGQCAERVRPEQVAVAVVAAALGAAVTAAALMATSSKVPTTAATAKSHPVKTSTPEQEQEEEEALVREQLARNISFMGEEAVAQVRKSFVVVVGLGGVGSHAAVMLARNGVQRIRLIDFDQVTLSSLNRHAAATRTDVGRPKVEVLKKYIETIAPFVTVDARVVLFNASNAQECFEGNPDFVLDCIDNIETKVALLKFCKDKSLQVMSSMGAGAKGDPSRIQISDIADTISDPLSRVVRTKLKKLGVTSGIPCVFSTEVPKVNLVPLDEKQYSQLQDYQLLPDFRIRILPVLGVIPAMFGNAMAAYVLQHLGGTVLEPLYMKGRVHLYDKWLQKLRMRERDHFNGKADVPFDIPDLQLVTEEVWRCRSPFSGSFDHLVWTRWRRDEPTTIDNIILVTPQELAKHEASARPEDVWNAETCASINTKLVWIKTLFKEKLMF